MKKCTIKYQLSFDKPNLTQAQFNKWVGITMQNEPIAHVYWLMANSPKQAYNNIGMEPAFFRDDVVGLIVINPCPAK